MAFLDDLRHTETKWGISGATMSGILIDYDNRYADELIKLATKPFKLPKYFRDNRDEVQYLYDLHYGWCVEDLIALWLRQSHEVERTGADAGRTIHKKRSARIRAISDFEVDGVSVELKVARKERQSYDIKTTSMRQTIKAKGVVLFVMMFNNTYTIITPKMVEGRKPIPNPRWGGKLVYNFDKDEFIFRAMKNGLHYV